MIDQILLLYKSYGMDMWETYFFFNLAVVSPKLIMCAASNSIFLCDVLFSQSVCAANISYYKFTIFLFTMFTIINEHLRHQFWCSPIWLTENNKSDRWLNRPHGILISPRTSPYGDEYYIITPSLDPLILMARYSFWLSLHLCMQQANLIWIHRCPDHCTQFNKHSTKWIDEV